jgi:hypothetical protein
MASLSKDQNGERQYPSLIVTVLAALVARNRELSSQIAFLSTEKACTQNKYQLSDERREYAKISKDAADVLVRAVVADQALQREQNSHKITMTALERELENNMAKNADDTV